MEDANNLGTTNLEGKETETAAKTYTEEEVQSMISKAVNGAVEKAKSKATKTSEERIAELEREISKRDNQEYCRGKMKELNIDSALAPLVYAGTNEESDTKLEVLSKWYEDAVDKAVKERIQESKPIKIESNKGGASRRKSLSELQAKIK